MTQEKSSAPETKNRNEFLKTATQVTAKLRLGVPEGKKQVIYNLGESLQLVVIGKNRGKFLYRGRMPGNRQLVWLTCGKCPDTTLAEARAKRDEFEKLLKQGINPNQLLREKKAEEARAKAEAQRTLAFVAKEYFSKKAGEISAKTLQGDIGRLENHVPATLRALPIVQITRADHLLPVIDALVKRKLWEQARKVASLLQRVFNFAEDCGYITMSPAATLCRRIPKQAPGDKKHQAALTDLESVAQMLKQLWQYFDSGRSTPNIASGLKLHCYLPIRDGDLVAARWEDIDLDKGLWTFPKTKNGRAYVVPISLQVKKILEFQKLFRINSWLFPSGSKLGHIRNESLLKVLRTGAGIPKDAHCLHGFRSTFQTIALEHGIPKSLTEQALFHVAGGSVEQAYNKAAYLVPVGLVLQWWADVVDALREGQPLPEVPARLAAFYYR